MAFTIPAGTLGTTTATTITLGDALAAFGTLSSVAGSVSSANRTKAAHEYNARAAQIDAENKRVIARTEADRLKERDRKLMASMRARMGAAGVDPGSGSGLALLTETAADAERDYRTLVRNGDVDAARLRSQARLDRMYGAAAQGSGYYDAGATLLTSLSDVARRYTS